MVSDDVLIQAMKSGLTDREIARRYHASSPRLKKLRESNGIGKFTNTGRPVDSELKVEEVAGFRERGDDAVATGVSDKPIKTLQEAIAAANVDTSIWHVLDWETSVWTVPLKVGPASNPVAIQQQQYRVKMRLKRILPKPLLEAANAIYERLAAVSKRVDRKPCKPVAGEPCMAMVSCSDVHFGKLAWGKETGRNFDLEVAERLYENAVVDLLAECKHRNISRFVLPIGNDFFHIDNSRNTTFAGTPQDVDGRYSRIIEAGEMAVIRAIQRLADKADVLAIWIPGNHDPTTSYHLSRTLHAWFRNDSRVQVEYGPSPRKYVRWGTNLIGFAHGDSEKIESLPNIMATERADDWGSTECREWILGHMHRSRQWVTKPVDTFEGTTVRVMKALCSADGWHHRKGYIGNDKSMAAEVYFYGESRGYLGHAVAPARFE